MMNRRIVLAVVLAAAVSLLTPIPAAHAIVKAPTPVSKSYAAARAVLVGKVAKFNAETGAVEASAAVVRGAAPAGMGEVVRIKIEGLPDVTARVKEGAPLVLFVARSEKNFALHLADTWLLPVAVEGKPGLFSVRQTSEAALRQSFPGSTAALAALVEQLKADKPTAMLNEVSPNMFKGGVKDLGKLDIGEPIAALRGFKAGGKSYLAASGAGGTWTVFAAAGGTLQKAPAGSVQIPQAATPEKLGGAPAGKEILSCVAGDFGEDAATPAALTMLADGLVRLPDGGDFTRLTGEHLATYFQGVEKPLIGATMGVLDCNGDGRTDVLLRTPKRVLLLINRGFGAFFINADIGGVLVDGSGAPLLGDKTLFTGADIDGDGNDDLVIVSPTGAASVVINTK